MTGTRVRRDIPLDTRPESCTVTDMEASISNLTTSSGPLCLSGLPLQAGWPFDFCEV